MLLCADKRAVLMDLNKLLKFYEAKINTKYNDDDVFLKKYDRKRNSVFDKKEFELLKKDLSKYAGIDFNEEQISDDEFLQLYNSKVDKKDRIYSLVEFGDKLKKELNGGKDPAIEELILLVEEFASDMELTPEEKALTDKYASNEKIQEDLSVRELKMIAKLDDKQRERLDKMLSASIEDVDISSLINVVKLTPEEKTEYAKELILKGIDPFCVTDVIDINPERQIMLNNIIEKLSEYNKYYDDENKNIVYEKSNFITDLVVGDDKKFKNLTKFMDVSGDKLTPSNLGDISSLCGNTTIENFDKVIELIEARGSNYFNNWRISGVVNQQGADYEKAKELYLNPEYDNLELYPLIKLDKEMQEQIKDYMKSAEKIEDFVPYPDYENLCKLSKEEFKRLQELSGEKLYDKPLDTRTLVGLAKCSKESYEKMKKFTLSDVKLPMDVLVFMAEANDDMLNNFLKEHSTCEFRVNNYKKTIDIFNQEGKKKVIRYNQHIHGFDAVITDSDDHTSEKVLNNTKQNRSQTISYKRIPSGYGERGDFVINQKIDTYDNNGSLLKTEKYEQSNLSGVPNITEIHADGTQKILQKSSIDKNGTLKIEKDFVSPDGTRTRMQSIEDEMGNRRSIYNITDKHGKVLLNRVKMFTVLSENKFQSSLNGQSHEIEYKDNEIVIKDMQTGKVSTISLDEKIRADKNDTFLNIIKKMSAEQLMVMKLNDINKFEYASDELYDKTYVNNATWRPKEKEIFIGKTTFTPTQKDFLQRNFSVMSHEYGHYIDWTAKEQSSSAISSNAALIKIFKEEHDAFLQIATSEEEKFMDYLSGTSQGEGRGAEERVAETNMLLQTETSEQGATRAYYLQRYFPRTVAAIAEEIGKIERKALEEE